MNKRRLACVLALWVGISSAGARGVGPLGLEEAAPAKEIDAITVTWLGVATLLFDDGATQVLIDGFFSRPAGDGNPIAPDRGAIERMRQAAGLTRLAAVIPVHSHYDHAMDVGVVSELTGALVIGSESTANIARGAGVAEAQIRVVAERGNFELGAFEVELVESRHAPLVDGGPPMPGDIIRPVVPPVPLTDLKEGGSYSILLRHPSASALVQGSAGYVEGALAEVRTDVVFLGIGGLQALGEEHADDYWREIVAASAARCVFPIHWDDFSRPYGELVPAGGAGWAVAWLRRSAKAAGFNGVPRSLPLGVAVALDRCGT